jgi:hypothetical protein
MYGDNGVYVLFHHEENITFFHMITQTTAQTAQLYVRFEVLPVVLKKILVVWYVMPC